MQWATRARSRQGGTEVAGMEPISKKESPQAMHIMLELQNLAPERPHIPLWSRPWGPLHGCRHQLWVAGLPLAVLSTGGGGQARRGGGPPTELPLRSFLLSFWKRPSRQSRSGLPAPRRPATPDRGLSRSAVAPTPSRPPRGSLANCQPLQPRPFVRWAQPISLFQLRVLLHRGGSLWTLCMPK